MSRVATTAVGCAICDARLCERREGTPRVNAKWCAPCLCSGEKTEMGRDGRSDVLGVGMELAPFFTPYLSSYLCAQTRLVFDDSGPNFDCICHSGSEGWCPSIEASDAIGHFSANISTMWLPPRCGTRPYASTMHLYHPLTTMFSSTLDIFVPSVSLSS